MSNDFMALFVTGVLAIVFFNAMGGDKEEATQNLMH